MLIYRTSRLTALSFALVMTVVVHATVLLGLDHVAQAGALAHATQSPSMISLATVTVTTPRI